MKQNESLLRCIPLLLCVCFLSARVDKEDQKTSARIVNENYVNPILGGDYPDPSIIRVGKGFYMVHSSFEYCPGLLVWHSTDLVNWERAGYALNEYIGSVWAPDLVYYNDKFYIYFPAGDNNYVVTAEHPEGPWSDPINLGLSDFIDPGHVVGPDGKRYLYLSNGYIVRLADDGLSTIGEAMPIYKGWIFPGEWSTECFCLEGPKSFYKDGFYYMISAEGGTAGPATSHMVVGARAKSPLGPWENSPYNPIIHTESRVEKWWSQGHGSLIDDIDGNYWMVFHGYENGFHTLGRQTLMLPIEWTKDNWFKVPDSITTSDTISGKPAGVLSSDENSKLSDDFSSKQLSLQWQFFKNYSKDRLNLNGKFLTLEAEGECFADSKPILVNVSDRKYEVSVEFTLNGKVTAGLCLFYNEQANVRIAVTTDKFSVYIQDKRKISIPNELGAHGYLRILNEENEVSFYFSEDGESWSRVERSLDATGYNHNVFAQFLSLRAGLYAFGTGSVEFDDFIYRPIHRSL